MRKHESFSGKRGHGIYEVSIEKKDGLYTVQFWNYAGHKGYIYDKNFKSKSKALQKYNQLKKRYSALKSKDDTNYRLHGKVQYYDVFEKDKLYKKALRR